MKTFRNTILTILFACSVYFQEKEKPTPKIYVGTFAELNSIRNRIDPEDIPKQILIWFRTLENALSEKRL